MEGGTLTRHVVPASWSLWSREAERQAHSSHPYCRGAARSRGREVLRLLCEPVAGTWTDLTWGMSPKPTAPWTPDLSLLSFSLSWVKREWSLLVTCRHLQHTTSKRECSFPPSVPPAVCFQATEPARPSSPLGWKSGHHAEFRFPSGSSPSRSPTAVSGSPEIALHSAPDSLFPWPLTAAKSSPLSCPL